MLKRQGVVVYIWFNSSLNLYLQYNQLYQ
jgi:hypothetical protein